MYPTGRRGMWGKATAEIVFLFGVDIQLNKVNFANGVDPEHINSCIPQPSHQTAGIRTSPPFFNHTTTPQTDYQNSLR